MEDPMAAHSNLYVRGWSADQFSEADLVQLFAAHGEITSLRMVAGGENGQAAPHAFVKMERPAQAASAIQALNGASISGGTQLVVKFADADVQPRVESGRQPSEWCYCRNLPATYTRQDVGDMFLQYGTVLEIRLFPSTELYKGSGALVQMQSLEQGAAAIQALNGSFPRGATQPLLVRFADSPAEKAAKQARKERLLHKQAPPHAQALFGNGSLLQLQQQLIGLAMGGSNQSMSVPSGSMAGSSPELSADLPSMLGSLDGSSYTDGNGSGSGGGLPPATAMLQQQAAMAAAAAATAASAASVTGASIYIKGMPEESDKLWLYEKFARFGGICSVRVLVDEQTGRCNGIGFVNYVSADAARMAQESMNGISMGDRLLHVMVQNPAARGGRIQPGPAMGNGGGLQASRPPGMTGSAASLGLNASALASLQAAAAGAFPSGGSSMQLSHMGGGLPLAVNQGYNHGGGMGGPPNSFGSLQW